MSDLTRQEYWPRALFDYLESVKDKPHVWGQHDCCLFAADCVREMTGVDLAASYRSTYDSAQTAMAALSALGMTKRELATQMLGHEKPAGFAQRGDVVYCEFEQGGAFGICTGTQCVFLTQEGLQNIPTSAVLCAFSV